MANKYQIGVSEVRHLYKKLVFGPRGGGLVWVDDDVITTIQGGAFVMKVILCSLSHSKRNFANKKIIES